MRRPCTILPLLAVAAGCAAAAPVPGRGFTPTVLVVEAPSPPAPANVIDAWAGSEDPAALLAREAIRAAKERGWDVVTVLRRRPGASSPAPAGTAVLTVALTRLELGALQPLGVAEVDLDVELVGESGAVLHRGGHHGATSVPTYRARQDWRVHLRAALAGALSALPRNLPQ